MKTIIFIIISLIVLGCYDIDITVLVEDTDNSVSYQIDDDYDAGDDGGN